MPIVNKRKYFNEKYGSKEQRTLEQMMIPNRRERWFAEYMPLPQVVRMNNWESIVYMLTVYGMVGKDDKGLIQAFAELIVNRWMQQQNKFGLTIRDVCLKRDDNGFVFPCWDSSTWGYKLIQQPDGAVYRKVIEYSEPIFHRLTFAFHNRSVCWFCKSTTPPPLHFTAYHKFASVDIVDFYSDPTLRT